MAHRWSVSATRRVKAARFASSGLAVTILYSVLSIFPIIDVPSWQMFALKVGGVVVGANVLGAGIYAVATRRGVVTPSVAEGD